MTALVWLRNDLRLHDNRALHAAAQTGLPVYVAYINDQTTPWALGGAAKWWAHHSLKALDGALDGALNLYQGDSATTVHALCARLGVTHVFWNRTYEPHTIPRDAALKQELAQKNITVQSFNSSLLQEPSQVRNKSGEPFKVFTPMWKTMRDMPVRACVDSPLPALSTRKDTQSLKLDDLALLPTLNWDAAFYTHWTPGEAGAERQLTWFITHALKGYATNRDRPDVEGTSRLSPHLRFGEIGPVRIWHRIWQEVEKNPALEKDAEKFLSEVGWREFSYHLLTHVPTLPDTPLRPEFAAFPWASDYTLDLRLWQRGQTGLPIVDAGMRELWQTGYMHNRVRMIVASVLIKNMLIPWQEGERWFWDTLVDADLANNSASWQWVAGCGADAAPYFRIFNPVSQGQKFDPTGAYVRRWVPELAKLDAEHIHAPWEAPKEALLRAGIIPGKTYPNPCVDLKTTRERALAAFATIKKAG
jgi:deoxyribodipyrimidine photo-lyase